jgi:hypothetical protein
MERGAAGVIPPLPLSLAAAAASRYATPVARLMALVWEAER